MSDKDLEVVVDVEYGGGITLFRVGGDVKTYLVEDNIPLSVGDRVRFRTQVSIGITTKEQKTETRYPRVTTMEIHDQRGCRTRYLAKNIVLTTEYKE